MTGFALVNLRVGAVRVPGAHELDLEPIYRFAGSERA
jgi:hypothetical protein